MGRLLRLATTTASFALFAGLLCLLAAPSLAGVAFQTSAPQVVTKGEVFSLSGTGASNGTVALWIVGRNYISRQIIIPDARGNYSYSLRSEDTRGFTSGQYAFVIQDPGANGRLDIDYTADDNGDIVLLNRGKTFADIGARENLRANIVPQISQYSSVSANPGADDIFTPSYLVVEDPVLLFDNLADPSASRLANVTPGERLVFRGETNIPAGDELKGEVRNSGSGELAASGSPLVTDREGPRRWVWDLGEARLPPGMYRVTVWRSNAYLNTSAMAQFGVTAPASVTPTPGALPVSIPWSDPRLPFVILTGLGLVIASILYSMRNR